MATNSRPQSNFSITPHKLSICVLAQIYAPPSQSSVPFPFSSVSQHNRLGIFLLALTKACDSIFEPTLDELISQMSEVGGPLSPWLIDQLMQRLLSLESPDDLFNFFTDLREILGSSDSNVMDDDQIMLDPNSNIGIFVRRCLLGFNQMSFEGICHLLTNTGTYCKESESGSPPRELSHMNDSTKDLSAPIDCESMEMDNFIYEKGSAALEQNKMGVQTMSFQHHMPKDFPQLVDGPPSTSSTSDTFKDIGPLSGSFLRTNWQVQGYLSEQAYAIEKRGASYPLYAFESILKQLQKWAPGLHRVHYLRYLNNLYHNDYPGALENLHRYFDYSAGTEGVEIVPPSGCNSFGRYEIALLCLGMMHFYLGHPEQALEVLSEAVRVSQQYSDDTCLAYTLAAISNLLSEVGISRTSGIIGSSYRPVAGLGTSLSVQQQLFVLLRRSLKRAESLKLRRLMASIQLEISKYDLTHIQRPLLSFGPKASMKLRTHPTNVYKGLWLSSRLISEFGDESSVMTNDGSFCTKWLKNLKKPNGPIVFAQENEIRSNSDAFQFSAHQTSIPESVLQLLGSSYLLRADSWEMYGSAPLARINALVFATCFADSSSVLDTALAYAKLIQHLAVYKGYKEAFAALKIAEEKFACVSKPRILLLKLQLLHEWALHRGNLKLAQKLDDELGVLASPVTGVDMELKTEACLRHARTLLAANQYSQAAAVAHRLFCTCYKFNMEVKNATVLLLLAEIHKRSGNAVSGIPYALASLSYCQSFNLDLLKASTILMLAELWLALGPNHAQKALDLLHGSFPVLLAHGGVELRCRAFVTEAKCNLADPSFSVSEHPELVLEPLRQASEEVQLIEYHEMAAESFYLMALVYDKLGQLDDREEAASSFKKHISVLENPDQSDNPFV